MKVKKRNNERTRLNAKKWRRKLKQRVFELLGNKCKLCNESDYVCLVVHHVNPILKSLKHKNKSRIIRYKHYLQELDNLILLCANCHRKTHARMRKDEEIVKVIVSELINENIIFAEICKIKGWRTIMEEDEMDRILEERTQLNLFMHYVQEDLIIEDFIGTGGDIYLKDKPKRKKRNNLV